MKQRKTLPIGEITIFSTIILCAIALLIEHSRNKKEEADQMKDPVYAQVVHEIEERDRLGWLNIFPLTFVALVVIAGFGGLTGSTAARRTGWRSGLIASTTSVQSRKSGARSMSRS